MNKRLALTAAGLAGVLVIGGGAALAATSGPESPAGVITGCYGNADVHGSHALILQDGGTSCPKGTTAISWNEQGPAGSNGTDGTSVVTSQGAPSTPCTPGDVDVELVSGGGSGNGDVLTCNSSGTEWSETGNIQGPQGNSGAQGASGGAFTWTFTCDGTDTEPTCTATSTDSIPTGGVVTPVGISVVGCGSASVNILDEQGVNLVYNNSLEGPDSDAGGAPLWYTVDDPCGTSVIVTFTFYESQVGSFS